MAEETDTQKTDSGFMGFVRLLPSRVINEVTHSPLSITLGLISALSIFVKTPSALSAVAESGRLSLLSMVEPERVIAWVLVALAINFVLARIGALVVRNKFWSGLLFSIVFGAIAILTSSYMAIEYLAPVYGTTGPQLSLPDLSERAKVWHGLHIDGITIICVGMWVVNAASAYGSEIADFVRSSSSGSEPDRGQSDDRGAVMYVSGLFVMLSLGALGALSATMLTGVSEAYVDSVLWEPAD